MAKPRTDEKKAAPKIPYGGFRLVFGLANGALWFVIAGAVLSGITVGVEGAGRLSREAALWMFGAVGFYACFFGLPGAIGGILSQAKSGRLALPPVETWGDGALAHIHLVAALRGLGSAAIVAGVANWFLARQLLPSRAQLCLLLAISAAAVAVVNAASLAGPRTLGDLRRLPDRGAPPAPDRRYYLLRFALPQGLGNGAIAALAALGTHPPATQPLAPAALVGSTVAVCLVIGVFLLLTGGGLAKVDVTHGLVAPAFAPPPPSFARRLQLLAGLVAVGALLAYALAAASGPDGPSRSAVALFQGLMGATVGATMAILSARAALRSP